MTKTYGGNIELSFDRTINREGDNDDKTIELDFKDFFVVNEGFLDDDEFFSDGVTEALRGHEEYGVKRLLKGLETHGALPAAAR